MTYEEALAYWYGRIDFERRPPKIDDLKLDRMRAVLRALGDPHRRLRIIHVAGTKGKGSTSAMLAAVLGAAGYRVGLFTSPHLTDVSERIQVDGVAISHDEISARLTEIAAAIRPWDDANDLQLRPTFFEIGTALGFAHFDCRRVEVALIEVGLGGRFDSTNVCSPLISVITNISIDHTAQLGDRLALIAREKAGIIKPGRPVITTADAPEAFAVIERIAAERQAPLIALGRDFHFSHRPGICGHPHLNSADFPGDMPGVQVTTARQSWPIMPLRLFGNHQAANAAGVVAVVEQLNDLGLPIDANAVRLGLANVRWPARLEVVGQKPLIVLDCAHNVASAQALVDTIRESFAVTGRKRLILAVSNDKQVAEMLHVLGPAFDHFHLTRFTSNSRCMTPELIASLLCDVCPRAHITIHEAAGEALQVARARSGPTDLIAISGSVFLAGELRPLLV